VDDPPSLHRYFYANANPTRFTDPDGHASRELAGQIDEFAQTLNAEDQARAYAANVANDSKPKTVQEGRTGPVQLVVQRGHEGAEGFLAYGYDNPDAVFDTRTDAGRLARLGQLQARGYRGPYEGPGGYTNEFGFRFKSFCLSCHGNDEVAQLQYRAGSATTANARFGADIAMMAFGAGEAAISARAARLGAQATMLVTEQVVDPVVDTGVLIRAFKASRGNMTAGNQEALSLLRDTSYRWVVTPSTYKEFTKIPHGAAAARRFLRSFDNLAVITEEAKTLTQGARFNEVLTELKTAANKGRPAVGGRPGLGDRPRIVNGQAVHTNYVDQLDAAFAEQLQIPYVTADKTFLNFLSNSGKNAGVDAYHFLKPPTQ
jgi:hypothetical protein